MAYEERRETYKGVSIRVAYSDEYNELDDDVLREVGAEFDFGGSKHQFTSVHKAKNAIDRFQGGDRRLPDGRRVWRV